MTPHSCDGFVFEAGAAHKVGREATPDVTPYEPPATDPATDPFPPGVSRRITTRSPAPSSCSEPLWSPRSIVSRPAAAVDGAGEHGSCQDDEESRFRRAVGGARRRLSAGVSPVAGPLFSRARRGP